VGEEREMKAANDMTLQELMDSLKLIYNQLTTIPWQDLNRRVTRLEIIEKSGRPTTAWNHVKKWFQPKEDE
jgi:hypothetical protein